MLLTATFLPDTLQKSPSNDNTKRSSSSEKSSKEKKANFENDTSFDIVDVQDLSE